MLITFLTFFKTCPVSTFKFEYFFAICISFAIFIKALLGIQPDQVHSPPGLFLSIKTTFLENPFAVYAAVNPPEPAPIMATSYSFVLNPPSNNLFSSYLYKYNRIRLIL